MRPKGGPHGTICATRHIAAGEELLLTYGHRNQEGNYNQLFGHTRAAERQRQALGIPDYQPEPQEPTEDQPPSHHPEPHTANMQTETDPRISTHTTQQKNETHRMELSTEDRMMYEYFSPARPGGRGVASYSMTCYPY